MTDRLPLGKISIPSRDSFADEVYSVIQELGFDPQKVARIPAVPCLVQKFKDGGYTRAEFKDSLRKIGIMNGWC